MRDITEVWARIEAHQREPFALKGGEPLTYEVVGNTVIPDRPSRYPIHVGQFEKALALSPVDGPVQLHHLRGPSYIWAILHDPRIRGNDW